jgi:hypothetical protein
LISLPDGLVPRHRPDGFRQDDDALFLSALHQPPDRKIITVEDPVEYVLAGINQVQVSERWD